MAITGTVSFTSASFSFLNVKTQSLVLYSTLDTSWNVLTFTIQNNTGADLNLAGGTPVNGTQAGAASSFAFDFRSILTDAQAGAMVIKDSLGQWGAGYFPPGAHTNPTWAVAPLKNLPFKNGDKVRFTITGIACTAQAPGDLDLLYFNVPGVTNRSFPFTYLVSVLNPPVGKNLKDVVDNGVLNASVVHIIGKQAPPPPPGSGPPPIEVDITYDNDFPIQNGFTLYLKNNSGAPLVPPGTPLGGAVITLSFLFGTDDDDAITTQSLGDSITIAIDAETSQWSTNQHQDNTANWTFTPLSQPLMAAGETVNFIVGNIITDLNVTPQTLSSMHIQWNFIPGYADGYYSIELQKQTATPFIPSFTILPAAINLGQNVLISYQTQVVAYITLAYERRDGTPVLLVSPTNIGYGEQGYSPPQAPDKEATVFALSVYRGPGLPVANAQVIPITVNQPPAAIVSFTASSMLVNINAANTITLSWQVTNAKTVAVAGFGTQTGTSLPVTVNATTTYTLQVTPWGSNGQMVQATLTVYAYKSFASIAVGPMGDGTAFQSLPISISNRSKGMIYVCNAAAGKVYQIIQANHTVSPTTYSGNILTLNEDEVKLYTAQQGGAGPGTISMYDTSNPSQVCTLPQPGPPPYSLAINPAGTQLYYLQQHRLTAVSAFAVFETGNSFAYQKDLAVSTSPEAYAFDAAGAFLYVGNYDSSNVSVINVAKNAVTATVTLESSEPCAFALVGTLLFVACSGDNRVCIIDTTNNTTKTPITAGFQPFSLTLDQNKARLFVTNFQGGSVTVINTATLAVITTLTVGNGPSAAKITDSGNLMFVSNYCDKSLTVVDISNGGAVVVGAIPLESTNGNPIDVSTFPAINGYTDVFVAKEFFNGRNNGCSSSSPTDANLNMSIFSVQEKGGGTGEEFTETTAVGEPAAPALAAVHK